MDDIRGGKVKAALFLFFIVVLIVGGYIGAILLTKDSKESADNSPIVNKNSVKKEDNRIDINKDYIYFTNEVVKNATREIIYQDVVFNFNSDDTLAISDLLNSERKANELTYKTISEIELTEEEKETILYEENDVYEATYNKYTCYFDNNYASVLNNVYKYHYTAGSKIISTNSYVFDINTGKLLSKTELMNKYNKSLENIKEVIEEKLNNEQTIIEEVPQIDIASTLKALDDENSYALYVNKSGYLVISYIIKNIDEDKLDVIILN